METLKLKIEIIDYFHSKPTLKYFECYLESITTIVHVPCKMGGNAWKLILSFSLLKIANLPELLMSLFKYTVYYTGSTLVIAVFFDWSSSAALINQNAWNLMAC